MLLLLLRSGPERVSDEDSVSLGSTTGRERDGKRVARAKGAESNPIEEDAAVVVVMSFSSAEPLVIIGC